MYHNGRRSNGCRQSVDKRTLLFKAPNAMDDSPVFSVFFCEFKAEGGTDRGTWSRLDTSGKTIRSTVGWAYLCTRLVTSEGTDRRLPVHHCVSLSRGEHCNISRKNGNCLCIASNNILQQLLSRRHNFRDLSEATSSKRKQWQHTTVSAYVRVTFTCHCPSSSQPLHPQVYDSRVVDVSVSVHSHCSGFVICWNCCRHVFECYTDPRDISQLTKVWFRTKGEYISSNMFRWREPGLV